MVRGSLPLARVAQSDSLSFGRAHDSGFPNSRTFLRLLDCCWSIVCLQPQQMMHPSISIVLHSPAAEFLIALALPAMVYFFFSFYGGQRAAIRSKPKTAKDIANLIDRFLNSTISYPQEWSDFVECRHPDSMVDSYRKRCGLRDPLVNSTSHKTPKPYQNSKVRLTTCGSFQPPVRFLDF
jgi:hypothetical protein